MCSSLTLMGMTPILAQLLVCTGRKMEQGRKIIPYPKRSKVGGGEGGLVVLLLAEQRRGWSLMILFACATRGLRRPSLDAHSG